MPVGSTIIGLDLDPIRPIPGCTTLVQDITTTQCRAELKRILKVSDLMVTTQGRVGSILHSNFIWAQQVLHDVS